VDHGRDVAAQRLGGLLGQAEPGALDVARHSLQPVVSRQPAGGFVVIGGAHERVDVPVAASEQSRQNLSSHESRGAGQEHGAHSLSVSNQARG
jgi:hypothetical protein